MTDWPTRKCAGDLHERRVKHELEVRGWTVDPCGQGTFSRPIQQALSRSGSALRNFPDMIAVRGLDIVTIDAKAWLPSTHTGRYAVSRRCVNAGLNFLGTHAPIPLYYVFADLGVLTPAEITAYKSIGNPPPTGSYYLIDARRAHSFNEVFGHPTMPMTA